MTLTSALLLFLCSVNVTPYLSLPLSWENRVIYYQSFEKNGQAEINTAGLELLEAMDTKADGIRGRCAYSEKSKTFQLQGAPLSPHQPFAVSFWWSLQANVDKNSGFGLFHLTNGKGFISHFVRSGPWCGLDRPAAVLQVYYLPDIQNVNGIYDRDIIASMDLKPGVWHNTVIVFSAGTLVSLYTDGKMVFQVRLTGRPFSENDQLNQMILGNSGELPLALDEIMILNRPLMDEEIADYFQAINQMHLVGYPVEK